MGINGRKGDMGKGKGHNIKMKRMGKGERKEIWENENEWKIGNVGMGKKRRMRGNDGESFLRLFQVIPEAIPGFSSLFQAFPAYSRSF